MKRQVREAKLLLKVSVLLLVAILSVAQGSHPARGQSTEQETRLRADNLESISFEPNGEAGKRVSVILTTNQKTREKQGLPNTVTVGVNGRPVDFERKEGGTYVATARLLGDEHLVEPEHLHLEHGQIRAEHFTREPALMESECNIRTVHCDQNCRSATSNALCIICLTSQCRMEWGSSEK